MQAKFESFQSVAPSILGRTADAHQPLTREQELTATPEELFKCNLRFAVHVAVRATGKGLMADDALAAALRGLWKAAQTFQAKRARGRFVSYAAFLVKAEISNTRETLSPGMSIPRRVLRELAALQEKGGLDGVRLSESARKRLCGLAPVFLDEAPAESWASRHDSILDETAPDPSSQMLVVDDHRRLGEWMEACLDEREIFILKRRFGIDSDEIHTYDSIGSELGVTRQRAEQLEKRALRRLRSYLEKQRKYINHHALIGSNRCA
jgi:RNA polymerase sigma factor (sigma-70 family)